MSTRPRGAAMVRLVQLILAIALLTGPAQAADKIALVCSGTQALEDRVPARPRFFLKGALLQLNLHQTEACQAQAGS